MDYKLKPVLDALEGIRDCEDGDWNYCVKMLANPAIDDLKTLMETHVLVEKKVMIGIATKGPVWVMSEDKLPPAPSKGGDDECERRFK